MSPRIFISTSIVAPGAIADFRLEIADFTSGRSRNLQSQIFNLKSSI
jgi:hypothetical protein